MPSTTLCTLSRPAGPHRDWHRLALAAITVGALMLASALAASTATAATAPQDSVQHEFGPPLTFIPPPPAAAAAAPRPVVHVAVNAEGTWWNGTRVDAVAFQHRCLQVRQVATTPLVVLSIDAAAEAAGERTLHALLRAGITDVVPFHYSAPPVGDQQPRIPPQYPPAAIRQRQQGKVVLQVRIDDTGRVLGTTPRPGLNVSPLLIESAIEAVVQWRFDPGVAEQDATGARWLDVPVNYTLNETWVPMPEP